MDAAAATVGVKETALTYVYRAYLNMAEQFHMKAESGGCSLDAIFSEAQALSAACALSVCADPAVAANTAFFGLALVQLGLLNFTFFTRYFRRPEKVGSTFVVTSIVCFVYIGLAEAAAFTVPFVRDVLDVPDPANLPVKLAVLGVGAVVFSVLTILAYHKSGRSFEALDC